MVRAENFISWIVVFSTLGLWAADNIVSFHANSFAELRKQILAREKEYTCSSCTKIGDCAYIGVFVDENLNFSNKDIPKANVMLEVKGEIEHHKRFKPCFWLNVGDKKYIVEKNKNGYDGYLIAVELKMIIKGETLKEGCCMTLSFYRRITTEPFDWSFKRRDFYTTEVWEEKFGATIRYDVPVTDSSGSVIDFEEKEFLLSKFACLYLPESEQGFFLNVTGDRGMKGAMVLDPKGTVIGVVVGPISNFTRDIVIKDNKLLEEARRLSKEYDFKFESIEESRSQRISSKAGLQICITRAERIKFKECDAKKQV